MKPVFLEIYLDSIYLLAALSTDVFELNVEVSNLPEDNGNFIDQLVSNKSLLVAEDNNGKVLNRSDFLEKGGIKSLNANIKLSSNMIGKPIKFKLFPSSGKVESNDFNLSKLANENFLKLSYNEKDYSIYGCSSEKDVPWFVSVQFQWIKAATGSNISRFRQVISIAVNDPSAFNFVELAAYTVNGEFKSRKYDFRILKRKEFESIVFNLAGSAFPSTMSDAEIIQVSEKFFDEAELSGDYLGTLDLTLESEVGDISDPKQFEALDGRVRFRPRNKLENDAVVLIMFDANYVANHAEGDVVVRRAGQMAIAETCTLFGLLSVNDPELSLDTAKVEKQVQKVVDSAKIDASVRSSEDFAIIRASNLRRSDLVRVLAPVQ